MAGAKGKPRKRRQTNKPDNPAQSARFIKAAQKLGLGGTGDNTERAMDALLRRKPKS